MCVHSCMYLSVCGYRVGVWIVYMRERERGREVSPAQVSMLTSQIRCLREWYSFIFLLFSPQNENVSQKQQISWRVNFTPPGETVPQLTRISSCFSLARTLFRRKLNINTKKSQILSVQNPDKDWPTSSVSFFLRFFPSVYLSIPEHNTVDWEGNRITSLPSANQRACLETMSVMSRGRLHISPVLSDGLHRLALFSVPLLCSGSFPFILRSFYICARRKCFLHLCTFQNTHYGNKRRPRPCRVWSTSPGFFSLVYGRVKK